MSSRLPRLAALGAVALPLLWGCAGEDANEQASFPRAPGSDDMREVPQGGIPEAMPTQETAMEGVPEGALPGYPGDGAPGTDTYADADPAALTDFRGTLDPHGQWVDDPSYGTMWQPAPSEVGSDFAPYVSGGHWGYDDSDNYVWVSDYSWGWAPYHYGRWAYGTYGWGWIPGRTYAPAWVTWRVGAPGFGYVGWAPLPPTWYWGPGGVALGLGAVPAAPYVFCGTGNLFSPTLSGRVVTAPGAVQSIAGQTHAYSPPASTHTNASGGRVPANPSIGGPSPQSLGIANNQIDHIGVGNPQLARAQQFARPSSAMALGVHGAAVGGQLGPLAGRTALNGGGRYPGGAVAGHPQLSSRGMMPSYGGAAHSYYNSRTSMQLGSSYGHGGSMRYYGAPGTTPHVGAYHPAYAPSESTSAPHPTTSSSAHFGGHYGGGGGGHGGRR